MSNIYVFLCLFFFFLLYLWQIQELVEAIVLPMTHKERFQKLGIRPPKGVLLYGPPGTGKTLMARACAAQTNATFLKLAGPQLVQVIVYPWINSLNAPLLLCVGFDAFKSICLCERISCIFSSPHWTCVSFP